MKAKLQDIIEMEFFDDGDDFLSDRIAAALRKYADMLSADVRKPITEQSLTCGPGPWVTRFVILKNGQFKSTMSRVDDDHIARTSDVKMKGVTEMNDQCQKPERPFMRAKLRVDDVSQFTDMPFGQGGDPPVTREEVEMSAVCRNESYPEDGSDENNTYAKFTPRALFEATINNPALVGVLKEGDEVYVDFTIARKA